MRRDMEYCRLLLIDLSNGRYNTTIPINDDGEKYVYHLELLEQAGFINLKTLSKTKSSYLLYDAPKLTWEGNDFLDSIVNDTIWENTKNFAREKGIEVAKLSFELMKDLAIKQGKILLGLD